MSPVSLHRAVARQTGDLPGLIARRGFSLTELTPPVPDPEPSLAVHCPGCQRRLPVSADDVDDNPEAEFWTDCPRCDAAFPFHPDELFVTETAAIVV
jgi:hypothetical protein